MKRMTVFLFLVGACWVQAQDWPVWRGPHQNFISMDTMWQPAAVDKAKVLWKVELGYGHSTVSIHQGHVYTLGETWTVQGTDTLVKEHLYCLDAATGKPIWIHDHAAQRGRYPGPGSTPLVTEDRVYFQSRGGTIYCVDRHTGKRAWAVNLVALGLNKATPWGCNSSPLLAKGKLLINAGSHGMALNPATGQVVWKSNLAVCGHASPLVFTQGDEILAAFQSDTEFSIVEIETGRRIASMAWDSDMDPAKIEGGFYLSGSHKRGLGSMRVAFNGTALNPVWQSAEGTHAFQPSMVRDGHAYTMAWKNRRNQPLQCIDLADGTVKWTQKFGEWGAPLLAGDHVLMVSGLGELVLIQAHPASYTELARLSIFNIDAKQLAIDGRPECVWTTPVLSDGRLLVRTTWGTLACIDLR